MRASTEGCCIQKPCIHYGPFTCLLWHTTDTNSHVGCPNPTFPLRVPLMPRRAGSSYMPMWATMGFPTSPGPYFPGGPTFSPGGNPFMTYSPMGLAGTGKPQRTCTGRRPSQVRPVHNQQPALLDLGKGC
jgi:hypothetical protein